MKSYDHKKIEKKWQKKWQELDIYKTSDRENGKENFYTLVEFPYPSGNLHVGHWYAFAVADIFVRFKKMKGFNVLFPIGFDSFGLPAENAAIKRGLNPKSWTYENIAHMREQFGYMGGSFDWSREVITSDPEYYKWTQWLFAKLFEKGLVYKGRARVNWCPSCKTVLANEQVVAGLCERCDTEVVQKEMEEWKIKITEYAEELLNGLDNLDWPEEIKESQRNWIGRSEGVIVKFKVEISELEIELPVFTTRADTLFGATYIALSPEHNVVEKLKTKIENWREVEEYINKAKKKTEIERASEGKEKTGVKMEGVRAINPATGEEIPVWIADYVLGSYGTGAVMAVPAHDERDFEFAQKYEIPVKKVIDTPAVPFGGEGLLINSGEFNGMTSQEAWEKITDKYGEKKVTYKLRDWSVGRQRYWGCPIPIVYDPEGNSHVIPEEHLPWILPEDVDFRPTGEPPLAKSKELIERTEKVFGKGWKPGVETLDTFVDSSWYFLRYLDPSNDAAFSSKEKQKLWMPVNLYSGGAEHTTLHLLYSRFFQRVLYDLGLVTETEPYRRRMNRGLIMGPDGRKMSKSKGNVIDPDDVVARLGADTVRTYLAFIGPYNEVGSYPWDPDGIVGVRRFLERIYNVQVKLAETGEIDEVLFNQTIKKVEEDISSMKLNTGVSQLMILLNSWDKLEKIPTEKFKVFLKLLAPYAPHIAEEIWHELGEEKSIHLSSWPVFDEEKLIRDMVTIAVQVNGKVRDEVEIPVKIEKEELVKKVLGLPSVLKWTEGKTIQRTIYVPGKLVNIVA
jgi:leucyl-tRNA synthetase